MTAISIQPYEPSLQTFFRDVNIQWLQKYFVVEPIDEIMLSDPRAFILDKGGYIYIAKSGDSAAGVFALMKVTAGVFELSKMAVAEQFQGQQIGNAMLVFAIDKAKQLGAEKLILYSNTLLAPAIHLYRKYGFVEVPVGTTAYKRTNIKMELTLLQEPLVNTNGIQ
jgi:ribosomal protein S18 acetylase RimI-like enzyme